MSSATPIPNWLEIPQRAAKKVAMLSVAAAPPAASLAPPAGRGRYRALTLNGTKAGAIDPLSGESYRFVGIRPMDLAQGLGQILEPMGYTRRWPPATPSPMMVSARTKALPHHEGSTIRGELYFERNLGVDRGETRRRDRRRWLGLGVGLGLGIPCIVLALTFANDKPFALFALPGGLLLGLALVSGLSFANADYWSDVVVASYRGTTREPVDPTQVLEVSADYDVQVQVVRALSQDWESKYGSGRTIQASVRDPGSDNVSDAIRSAFTSPPLR